MSISILFSVALGGAMGAVLRYGVTGLVMRYAGAGFPYGTLAVNALGSLLIGLVAGWCLREMAEAKPMLQAFLITGLLGGFTTFSAFSLETVSLLQRGDYTAAFSYIAASLLLCVSACALGLILVKVAS